MKLPIFKTYYISFPNDKFSKVGITLQNNRGPGVKISKLDSDGQAIKAGLMKNQIILFLNNVPCVNHKQAIDIIDYYKNSKQTIVCKIL